MLASWDALSYRRRSDASTALRAARLGRVHDEGGGPDQAGVLAKGRKDHRHVLEGRHRVAPDDRMDALAKKIEGLRHPAPDDDAIRAEQVDEAGEPPPEILRFAVHECERDRVAAPRRLRHMMGLDRRILLHS